MICYQVDECLNSKRFVASCLEQGLVKVRRFPKSLLEQKDPEVLEEILPSGYTLLTTDKMIHDTHREHIPLVHAGILILAFDSPQKTMTDRRIMRLLSQFKASFPGWHELSLRNSIVQITDGQIEVSRVIQGRIEQDCFFLFTQERWQAEVSAVLKRNSERTLLADDS